ncbi:MAG: DHA2 family efflux MFS transporter permease subunit [Desulfotomaculaceae bacterium]|nr:DHA2 family efflux MFS transporter permease subunit [Desulfotomaculaceae bacterium]
MITASDALIENQSEIKIPWGAVLILVLGAFISILDSSIVNVALPRMMAVFGASTENIQWVLTGYMLAAGVVIPISGYLCKRFGSKRIYILALVVFTLGSLFCGLAWSTNSIIIARIVQAVGGGMLMPVSMSMLYFMVPEEKSGIALGVWGIAAAMAPAIGPTLGGYLVDSFSWRWIFTINIPIGLLAMALSANYLKETPLNKELKPDLIGSLWIIIACFCLLLALSKGQDWGWSSQNIVTLFVISGFSAVLFFFWEASVPEPLFEMRLFKNPVMLASLAALAVVTILLFSVVFLVPIYAQNLLGYSSLQTGILMMPMALVTGLFMPISGKLFDKFGAFGISLLGLVILIGLTYQLRLLSLDTSYNDLQILLALRAGGIGLAMMPIANAGMLTVPESLVANASALNNLVRQISGSMGVAFTTYMVSRQQAFHLAAFSDNINYGSPATLPVVNQLQSYLASSGVAGDTTWSAAIELIRLQALKQSYMNGINDAIVVLTVIGLLGIPLLFMLTRRQITKQRQKEGILGTGSTVTSSMEI